MAKALLLLVLLCLAAGCQTAEKRQARAYALIQQAPWKEQPACAKQLLAQGRITAQDCDSYLAAWQAQEAENKLLATMTPKERAFYLLQKEQLEIQRQQLAAQRAGLRAQQAANTAATLQNNAQYMQNNAMMLNNMANTQAIINSQTYQQPVYYGLPPYPFPKYSTYGQ